MLSVEIRKTQLDRLATATARAGKKMKKELAAAINAVSKKTKLQMGRDVRNTINLKKDEAEKPISIRASAAEGSLFAVVQLKKTPRLGLRHFGARQDKRGVSYKISKHGGRARIDGAFQGPKPGVIKPSWKGNVFARVGGNVKMTKGRYQGKMRQQIEQKKGVSAYGAYVKNNLAAPLVSDIESELMKQINRRINLNILRAEGLVKT
jgi:hypothetical protein